jgi:hypothetical protein
VAARSEGALGQFGGAAGRGIQSDLPLSRHFGDILKIANAEYLVR